MADGAFKLIYTYGVKFKFEWRVMGPFGSVLAEERRLERLEMA